MQSEIRRIQLTGGATLTVSLPKNWARDIGLRQGDLVVLTFQPDGSIIITPKKLIREEEKEREAVIKVERNLDAEAVVREVIAYYLVGYDVIKVIFSEEVEEDREFIKSVIRQKTIGLEVMEESADEIVFRSFISYADFPLREALVRMGVITSLMIKDVLKALKEFNKSLAQEINRRDDNVDRLYLFIVRQLKFAVRNITIVNKMGLRKPRDCLGYRLIVKSVERVADHAARIAKLISGFENPLEKDILKLILEMGNRSLNIFENSLKSFFELNIKLAHKLIGEVAFVTQYEQKITEKILSNDKLSIREITNIKLILESLRRIADYGADIAEIAINLAVEEP
ncbi:MAG: AbrB/MazE/SpoVT family DNA-binding domain-containing protein [Candidatus Odinarchaeota archaeon]|nr:AbrB/MazE/SpoVT family DNA-binding domain-containing protein [Candidatus Odinarchaeota archaeon]